MPEGPELRISSLFVNKFAQSNIFTGKVVKSEVSTKNPEINWDVPRYSIRAESRGKEVKLRLEECVDSENKTTVPKKTSILLRFGMSGCFKTSTVADLPKHSHLRFFTLPQSKDKTAQQVLSFVDFRRFGHWEVDVDWGSDRGPCPISDYENFRKNVVENLEKVAFRGKPICEVLLNQKYFNGIGNYLRAEILYRAKIPPFVEAKTALLPWKEANPYPVKSENSVEEPSVDPLYLCHIVCNEVLNLSDGYDVDNGLKEASAFNKWLRCYQNPTMNNLTDNHKRTMWFEGEPGPLVPIGAVSRRVTPSKKVKSLGKVVPEKEVILPKIPKLDIDKPSARKPPTRSSRRLAEKRSSLD